MIRLQARCLRSEELGNFFEGAELAVFADIIPPEIFSVHGNVNAGRKGLRKRKRAAEIEQTVGASKRIWNHGACKHDGFVLDLRTKYCCSFHHRIGAMCDYDFVFRALLAILQNDLSIGICHVQAVNHHDRACLDFKTTTPELQHLGKVRVLKVQPSVDFIVFFIKCAASDKNLDAHKMPSLYYNLLRMMKLRMIFCFCLILFVCSLFAGEYFHNIVREEVRIPLRDGIKLGATLYRSDQKGQYPALVFRTPYSKEDFDSYAEFPRRASREGYLVFLVDVRGRYTSEGQFTAYANEKADGFDVIEWVGKHPYCNGKVGTFGRSYPGYVQWLALSQDPPALKAASPGMTPIGSHHFFYVGGAASYSWFDWFIPYILPDKKKRAGDFSDTMDQASWDRTKREWYQYRPLVENPLLKKYAPEYYEWLRHPDVSTWWSFADTENDFSKMKAPVFLISGWYDAVYGVIGATKGLQKMRSEAGSEIAKRNTRLVIGPWNHTLPELRKTVFGDIDFGPSAGFDGDEELLRWFDQNLKDIPLNAPPVLIFVMGRNQWRTESEWPLTRAISTPYYLQERSELGKDPPGRDASDSFVFDPANPLWDIHSDNSVPYDQRDIENRKDVLVYTSLPLETDLEVTGEVAAELYVKSTARDTDFAITLCDVYPDGKSINLTGLDAGYLRMRYRNGFAKQELMQPGEIYKVRIGEVYTSNMFKKGHRIRLQITSSKAPHYDPNPNTGTEIATEKRLMPATQTILHGGKHPSRLILPVINGL